MSADHDVLVTISAFYAAFADGNAAKMEQFWAETSAVSCLHPGWPPVYGREQVLESWRTILEQPPEIRAAETRVMVFGTTAVVVCEERVGPMVLAATNVFIHEGAQWKLVHRQVTRLPDAVPPRSAMH